MRQKHIKESGKVRIGYDLAERFNQKQYEEYSDKKSTDSSSPYNVMKHPSYKVSSKKIGGYVRKLGLTVERDSGGFFIPVLKEYPKIRALANRYRLDRLYVLPEDPMKISGIVGPREKKEEKTESTASDSEIQSRDDADSEDDPL